MMGFAIVSTCNGKDKDGYVFPGWNDKGCWVAIPSRIAFTKEKAYEMLKEYIEFDKELREWQRKDGNYNTVTNIYRVVEIEIVRR